jgi:hypothetical protein
MRAGSGALVAPEMPSDIKYVEDALAHLLQGHFAPRSDKNFDGTGQNIQVPVVGRGEPSGRKAKLVVPDVSGELWVNAVETREIPSRWMSVLEASIGALLFVRIGSEQNVSPLDWVTSAGLLRMPALAPVTKDTEPKTPTQVTLCELISFLRAKLPHADTLPRVAIAVTAWDRLDAETAAKGPSAYLESEYPLLAGKIRNIQGLEMRVFGVSIVGGDFAEQAFKDAFFQGDLKDSGYVVVEEPGNPSRKVPDLTLPVAWLARKTN